MGFGAIFQVNGHGVVLPANFYRNTLERAGLIYGPELDLVGSVATGKANDATISRINESSVRVVLDKLFVDFLIGTASFGWTFTELYSAKTLANFGLGFPVNSNDGNSAATVNAHKVDARILAHHSCDVSEILGQACERNRLRGECVDFEAIFVFNAPLHGAYLRSIALRQGV
jgi:hypothetical protein